MKLRTFYITKEQDQVLRTLGDITVSEHIRRALDEYISKLTKLKVSTSRS